MNIVEHVAREADIITCHRGYRFKAYPSDDIERLFDQFAGVCRLVYNLGLEQRRKWGKTHHISVFRQIAELKLLRASYDWVSAVAHECEMNALHDLDAAYRHFFAGKGGYPTARKKGVHDTFRFSGRYSPIEKINAKWSRVRLPKIGWVKFRDHLRPSGDLRSITVFKDTSGWHLSLTFRRSLEVRPRPQAAVGVDLGVANTLALSNGELWDLPKSLEDIGKRYRRAQRIVARRKKGSKRRLAAINRCARLAAKWARSRKDWHHKVSKSIAGRFGTVVVEALKIPNMTASAKGSMEKPGVNVRQKAGLNRAILNQSWGTFRRLLSYKLEACGGTLATVNPAYTSQTCSECGVVDKESRKSQAVFHCVHCGLIAHADTNAAINILRRSTASMGVEVRQWPADEAPTRGGYVAEKPAETTGGCCLQEIGGGE